MRTARIAALSVFAACLAAPQAASAGPVQDFTAVFNDWRQDQTVTRCLYSASQLESAEFVTGLVSELRYTDFPAALHAEVVRVREGRCARPAPNGDSVLPPGGQPSADQRAASAIGRLRIARAALRGREYVRITNKGTAAASLAGATIRNRRGARVRIARGTTVQPGRTVTVRLAKRNFFADRGDVAQLVDRAGRVISQHGAGRYRGTFSF